MHTRAPFRVLTVLALAASLTTAGCMEAAPDLLGDDEIEAQAAQSATVRMAAENATEDVAHLGLELDGVFVHNASIPQPDGYHEMDVTADHADLVADGEGSQVSLASRTLPVGTYDQIVLRVGETDVQTSGDAEASDDASAEGNGSSANESTGDDGHGDHDHAHDGDAEGNASTADEGDAQAGGGFDVPINVTFEVTGEASTSVELVLDAGASASGEAFQPTFLRVEIARDGEVVEEIEDPDVGFREGEAGPTGTPPPAARMTVFDGEGDKVHEPGFQAESGAFVNSMSTAFSLNRSQSFSAAESEAVADGATLESFRWDFGDGETATGRTTNHSYEKPGAYEVTLTATDSLGVSDEHTLRVVVTTDFTALELDTSFEEGEGNWTAENGARTSWSLDSGGYESDTAWHVSGDVPGTAYGPFDSASLLSPNITIPEDWMRAGYSVQVRGEIADHFGCVWEMIAEYHVDGNLTVEIARFGNENQPEWLGLTDWTNLTDHAGSEVTLEFRFESTCDMRIGDGWYVDAVTVGGIPEDEFQNAELLEEAEHDGHDHEH